MDETLARVLEEISDANLLLFYRGAITRGRWDRIPRRTIWKMRDRGLVHTWPNRLGIRLTDRARSLLRQFEEEDSL
jgi:hypothetical protein